MNSFHSSEDSVLNFSCEQEIPEIALVKNPTDPNCPETKLVLGVQTPRSRGHYHSESRASIDKSLPSPRIEPSPLPPVVVSPGREWQPPRHSRPTCVPSTVARCFCKVDILYE